AGPWNHTTTLCSRRVPIQACSVLHQFMLLIPDTNTVSVKHKLPVHIAQGSTAFSCGKFTISKSGGRRACVKIQTGIFTKIPDVCPLCFYRCKSSEKKEQKRKFSYKHLVNI